MDSDFPEDEENGSPPEVSPGCVREPTQGSVNSSLTEATPSRPTPTHGFPEFSEITHLVVLDGELDLLLMPDLEAMLRKEEITSTANCE
jgi:hypothetical protein